MRQLGLPVVVVSNIDRPDVVAAIAHLGLIVDGLVTSDDVRAYKPRPEMFRWALDQLGLGAGAALLVGDSRTNDISGGRAAGIPVAWVNRTGQPEPTESRPDYVVPDLGRLAGMLGDQDHEQGGAP